MLRPIDAAGVGYGSDGCSVADPLQVIADEHALQLELCNLLEALADSLPYNLDQSLVKVAVSILSSSWPQHISIEEECLFPMLRRRAKSGSRVEDVLEQLELEHNEDEDRADEIVCALKTFLDTGALHNPESLGYMLRGFFQAQRRHIIWENDVVLPTAREVLSKEDLNQMQAWMTTSDHPRCSHRSIVEIRNAQRRGNICDDCPDRIPPKPNGFERGA